MKTKHFIIIHTFTHGGETLPELITIDACIKYWTCSETEIMTNHPTLPIHSLQQPIKPTPFRPIPHRSPLGGCLHLHIDYSDIINCVHWSNGLNRQPRWCHIGPVLNILRPRQHGRHFADDNFKCIFLNENGWIPLKISLTIVPMPGSN